MAFDYLVLIDVQVCRCPICHAPYNSNETIQVAIGGESSTAEVIEFSWVVFDVASQQSADEKQIFVKPQRTQQLSFESKYETGITDDLLEGAGTLQSCIQVLNEFAKFVSHD